MQPFKSPLKNELFSGLTFSLSDINLETSGLNLVPISLDSFSSPGDNCKTDFCQIKEDLLPPLKLSNVSLDYSNSKYGVEKSNNAGIYSRYVLNPEAQTTEVKISDDNINLTREPVQQYEPVTHHWFYQNVGKLWLPFSVSDSTKLEFRYIRLCTNNGVVRSMDSLKEEVDIDDCVPVDGGRYDVHIIKRIRAAVYWNENISQVRRVSWMYREEDGRCQIPYTEQESELLETKYSEVVRHNMWHQWLQIPGINDQGVIDDQFVFHSPHTMAQYRRYEHEDILGARVVYRGVASVLHLLEQGDSDHIDHVVLVVHGIGPICDMRGHNLVECVSEMRRTSANMMRDHFGGHHGRVEYLPVCWNSSLHTHIDSHLARVTLGSVPKLRVFTNGALVDVLCYSSPGYCQTIISSVAAEMNRLRHLFVSRNPDYDGSFSIVGHSLGAVIALDLISLQHSTTALQIPLQDPDAVPALEFELGHLFALGSPISLFLTARGLPFLGPDFQLPGCKGVFNIFHPFDPVAYRMEPMLVEDCPQRPVLVPHHKGRKRLHLELKDNLAKVGSDLKSRLLQTLKITWSSLQEFANAHSGMPSSQDDNWAGQDNEDVMRVLGKIDGSVGDRDDCVPGTGDVTEALTVGRLNGGRRVDHVLQEAPLESFNDYLFALGSHACYWDSEDTLLKIIGEIYLSMGVVPGQSSQLYEAPSQSNVPVLGSHHEGRLYHQAPLSSPQMPQQVPSFVPRYSQPPPMPTIPAPGQSLPPPQSSVIAPIPYTGSHTRQSPAATMASALPLTKKSTTSIIPPTLPVIQRTPFFQPSTLVLQSDIIDTADTTQSVVDHRSVLNLPPISCHNSANISTDLCPPYQHYNQSSVAYFQPQLTDQSQLFDTDSYFCPPAPNDDSAAWQPQVTDGTLNPSLESIYYQNFDNGHRDPSTTSNNAWMDGTQRLTNMDCGTSNRETDEALSLQYWQGGPQDDYGTALSSGDGPCARDDDIAALWRGEDDTTLSWTAVTKTNEAVPSHTDWMVAVNSSGIDATLWDTSDSCVSASSTVTTACTVTGKAQFVSAVFADQCSSRTIAGQDCLDRKGSVTDKCVRSSPRYVTDPDVSRTPSPRVTDHGSRMAARNLATAPNIFSSKPLVPQSGKLFTKKRP